ncbi:MAG: glycosyltransferase family 92 protein, partial [Balneolaceae bacterium]|nr:glycosyltransferase family 92 protein [Balneolaceae bacterium]
MKKYFLSFATNFKDENPYLKEWIDFHRAVGVDHFYLFNQCGSDESWNILEPYIARNIVTVHDWTNFSSKYEGPTYFFQKNRNHLAYMHAARNYRE